MSEATVTPLPSKPVAVPDFRCDECGRTFTRAQALGRHRSATHGAGKAPKGPKVAREPTTAHRVDQAASERQLLAVVGQAYHDLCGADVSTCIDSAAEILDAITNAGWRIVEAP